MAADAVKEPHDWIGYVDEEGKFSFLIHCQFPYEKWMEWTDAGERQFDFWYVPSSAPRKNGMFLMDASDAERKVCPVPQVNTEEMIYLRFILPHVVEYAGAKNQEEAMQGNLTFGPIQVHL